MFIHTFYALSFRSRTSCHEKYIQLKKKILLKLTKKHRTKKKKQGIKGLERNYEKKATLVTDEIKRKRGVMKYII